jgi:hypothetical protein
MRRLLVIGILLVLPAAPSGAAEPQDPPKDGGAPPAKPDDKPPADKPPADKPPADKPPADKPPADKPPVDEKAAAEAKAAEIKAFLKQYEEQLSKMTDAEAILGLTKLKVWYVDPKVAEEQKKEIIKLFMSKIVKQKKDAYLEAAAKVLGEMGGEESVSLIKYLVEYGYGVKGFVRPVVCAGLQSFGKIASMKEADVKWLMDQLKGKKGDDEFVSDVCKALSCYDKAPGSVRRDIFEQILLMSEGVYSKVQGNDTPSKRKWNSWGTDAVDAMKKLARFTKETTPIEFRKWFNDKGPNGGKNPKAWPDEPLTAPAAPAGGTGGK